MHTFSDVNIKIHNYVPGVFICVYDIRYLYIYVRTVCIDTVCALTFIDVDVRPERRVFLQVLQEVVIVPVTIVTTCYNHDNQHSNNILATSTALTWQHSNQQQIGLQNEDFHKYCM